MAEQLLDGRQNLGPRIRILRVKIGVQASVTISPAPQTPLLVHQDEPSAVDEQIIGNLALLRFRFDDDKFEIADRQTADFSFIPGQKPPAPRIRPEFATFTVAFEEIALSVVFRIAGEGNQAHGISLWQSGLQFRQTAGHLRARPRASGEDDVRQPDAATQGGQ